MDVLELGHHRVAVLSWPISRGHTHHLLDQRDDTAVSPALGKRLQRYPDTGAEPLHQRKLEQPPRRLPECLVRLRSSEDLPENHT